jgi:hypothetical protein
MSDTRALDCKKVIKILYQLGSANEGTRNAAVRAIEAVLAGTGIISDELNRFLASKSASRLSIYSLRCCRRLARRAKSARQRSQRGSIASASPGPMFATWSQRTQAITATGRGY